jgi:transcriptional regulator with XRE-family HTH domain
MPSKSIPISPAIAQLLRDRRRSLGLTLRAVADLSRGSGDPIPHSTLARIESGRLDPGVRRLQRLLALYQLPIQAAGDVLDLEAVAGATPIERDPEKLRDRAIDAWRHGRVSEALACFLAFRRRVPDDEEHRALRHEAILSFAVAASSLGKVHLSRQMLDELLLEKMDAKLLVSVLVQQSVVWRLLGSPVAALAFVDRAAAYVRSDSPRQRGWVEHQRGMVLMAMREFPAAERSLQQAIRSHRRANSPHDEVLALQGLVRLRFEEDRAAAALATARRAERLATAHRFHRLRLSAMVDQARALLELGSPEDSRALLRSVLADSMVREEHAVTFYAHFYRWKAELEVGNHDRAAVELQEAGYYLKYVDRTAAEAVEVGARLPAGEAKRLRAGRRAR